MPTAVKLPFANENKTARACRLCRWLSLSLLPRTAAPAGRAAHLVPRAVKQWVRIAHDLPSGETPL
jgi:hypothetical protein